MENNFPVKENSGHTKEEIKINNNTPPYLFDIMTYNISDNYTKECYVLKMDIKGYFIHIDRLLLTEIINTSIDKMSQHKVAKDDSRRWIDVIDIDFVKYLTNIIATLNSIGNCIFRSPKSAWIGLPSSKILFLVKDGCGLPIGNLTSQLFSNIYLSQSLHPKGWSLSKGD